MLELVQATAELETLTGIRNEMLEDIPRGLPASDGVQRIRSISKQVSAAREGLTRAHNRLSDFYDHGTIPEDLK